MTFAQLKALISVVECGGFTRAAALTGTSQPAVSHAVASLERELGAKLLARRHGRVQPTELGLQVAALARTILASAEEIRDSAVDARRSIIGTVQLAASPEIADCLLPAALELATGCHPGIDVTVLEGDSDEIPGWLKGSLVDVAFLPLTPALESIEHETVGADEYLALIPTTHPFAARAALTLDELAIEPFIMTIGSESSIAHLFAGVGRSVRAAYLIRQPTVVAKVVAQGLGVSIVSSMSRCELDPAVSALPLDPPARTRLAAFWPERRKTAAARAIVAAVRAIAEAPHGGAPRGRFADRNHRTSQAPGRRAIKSSPVA